MIPPSPSLTPLPRLPAPQLSDFLVALIWLICLWYFIYKIVSPGYISHIGGVISFCEIILHIRCHSIYELLLDWIAYIMMYLWISNVVKMTYYFDSALYLMAYLDRDWECSYTLPKKSPGIQNFYVGWLFFHSLGLASHTVLVSPVAAKTWKFLYRTRNFFCSTVTMDNWNAQPKCL